MKNAKIKSFLARFNDVRLFFLDVMQKIAGICVHIKTN